MQILPSQEKKGSSLTSSEYIFIIFNERQYLRPSISFCPYSFGKYHFPPFLTRCQIHFEKWQICSRFPKSKKVSYPAADNQFIDKFFNQASNCQEQKVFKRLSHLTRAKTIERLNWITILNDPNKKKTIIVAPETSSNG